MDWLPGAAEASAVPNLDTAVGLPDVEPAAALGEAERRPHPHPSAVLRMLRGRREAEQVGWPLADQHGFHPLES